MRTAKDAPMTSSDGSGTDTRCCGACEIADARWLIGPIGGFRADAACKETVPALAARPESVAHAYTARASLHRSPRVPLHDERSRYVKSVSKRDVDVGRVGPTAAMITGGHRVSTSARQKVALRASCKAPRRLPYSRQDISAGRDR